MKKKASIYFFLSGILLGFLFPISAYVYELFIKKNTMKVSFSTIILLHKQVNALYIIDSFPIFFGIFFLLIGLSCFKFHNLNQKLYNDLKKLKHLKNKLILSNYKLKKKLISLEENYELDSLTGLQTENYLIKNFIYKNQDILITYINISHFREINKIFGINIGNKVLLEFSKRLKENGYDCYKGYGDEFILLTYQRASIEEIDIMANYMFDLLSNDPYLVENNEFFLTVNFGFSLISKNIDLLYSKFNIKEHLYKTNFSLKYAKEKDLRYFFYEDNYFNNKERYHSYEWKEIIIKSIKNSYIYAFYQPIINNNNGKIEKYEALMRLKEDNKYISPYFFLFSSKKYCLYNSLTKIMINHALTLIEKTNVEISINISIDDINDITTMNFLYSKLKNLNKKQSKNIIFELIESERIENYEKVKEFIKEIKKYDCKIAIDDFGSGYSNFNYALNLDINYIKIDSSIIKNLDTDRNSEYIANLIVSFSKKLGIKTIAEFVHSKEIFKKVKALGIDYSQGYYFSEPLENII